MEHLNCSKLQHISLLSQLKQYRLDITALQEMSRKGKDIIDMKSNTNSFTVVKRDRERERESLGWHL
jgi:hypothetical protein